jgi:D-alanine transaminase
MTIPFNDRVCFFGDGVYDATYSANYKIYALDDHIDRFFNSAGLLDINLPVTKDEMKSLLYDMVKKVETGDLFVYWQATRGTQIRNHAFDPEIRANIWIVLKPAKIKDVTKKLKVITGDDTRFLHCNIKTLNLLPSVMASQRAESIGCDETILHRDGRVTECAHSNVSILRNGKLITAPTDRLILPGITRMHIIKMCKRLGIPVEETPFKLEDIFTADEVIISSAGQLCMGVSEVDGKPVGGKAPELLKKIQDALLEEFYLETAAE